MRSCRPLFTRITPRVRSSSLPTFGGRSQQYQHIENQTPRTTFGALSLQTRDLCPLEDGIVAGEVAPHDQQVDLVGAFVGVYHFGVKHKPRDVVLKQDSIAA